MVKQAVEKQMQAKGFKEAPDAALELSYAAGVSKDLRLDIAYMGDYMTWMTGAPFRRGCTTLPDEWIADHGGGHFAESEGCLGRAGNRQLQTGGSERRSSTSRWRRHSRSFR